MPQSTATAAWRDFAACYGKNTDIFFPTGEAGRGGGISDHDIAKAKAICARCPVGDSCLQYALTKPERDGIWGGMTAEERREERRRWSRRKHTARGGPQ